jgi:hypothetical protein
MKLQFLAKAALALLPVALLAQGDFDIALIGDVPYGAAAEPRYERMIADINKQAVEFTAHVGDSKSGSTRCDDSHYTKTLNYFNSFERALLYSVGDNEWTDCMRVNNGAFDPLTRLALARKTYFPTNMSMGRRPIPLMRQSDDPKYSLYVENAMLVKGPVVFVTIHAPGSNNNLEYKNVQAVPNTFYDNDKEYTARNAANLAWLRKAFQTAKDTRSLGIMILAQANMFEAFFDPVTGNSHSGYADFIAALREETGKFAGEVVMVSGDTHFMRVDKPLTDQFPACVPATDIPCKPFDAALDARGNRVLNFTRVEVPGSADVHWVLCHVRPTNRNIFQFEFMILPAAVAPTGVRAVIAPTGTAVATNVVEVQSGQIVLNGSQSASTNSGLVSYAWASAPGYPVPAIVGADSAMPLIQFAGRGEYQVVLTVTDRTGAKASTPLTIRYR